jgi:phosphate transport system permease protein
MPETMDPNQVSRPPTTYQLLVDRSFRGLCQLFAWLSALLVVFIVVRIATVAWPAIRQHGLGFLTGTTWDPNTGQYAILPEVWGTLYSSLLALIGGSAFGVSAALFLSEGFLGDLTFRILKIFGTQFHPFWGRLPERLEHYLKNLIELLAAIPSVVYGLWGLFVVIPLIRPVCNWLHLNLGVIPLFGTSLSGPGMLPAAMVLSIMILPTITAISRDVLVAVPPKLRMASYGFGRDALGDDSRRRPADSLPRNLWSHFVGIWPRPWGDDGSGDVDRKRQRHQHLLVLAGQHPRSTSSQQLP